MENTANAASEDNPSIPELKKTANLIRQDIVKMLSKAKSGHPAGALGMADIFTALYFKVLKHDSKNPTWEERDRLVLSNGHICPVLYASLARSGYFPVDELNTLRKIGSRLQGHPHRTSLPGLETTSGPLGSGLSQACGMAKVAKMDRKNWRVFCIASDGEHDEGNFWEAVMFASKNKLDNLTLIIDRNNIQISGNTEDVMPLESIKDKYMAFRWYVYEINGNNMEEILNTLEKSKEVKDMPVVIIANTTAGKGVSFMENRYEWHGTPPDVEDIEGAPKKGDQTKVALEELKVLE